MERIKEMRYNAYDIFAKAISNYQNGNVSAPVDFLAMEAINSLNNKVKDYQSNNEDILLLKQEEINALKDLRNNEIRIAEQENKSEEDISDIETVFRTLFFTACNSYF